MARKVRQDAAAAAQTHVRLSVPIPVKVHARLCYIAADRRMDRSELAASFVVAALKEVQVTGLATVPGGDPADGAEGAARS